MKTIDGEARRPLIPFLAVVVVVAVIGAVLLATHKPSGGHGGGKNANGQKSPPSAPPGMVYIPGGNFVMGNDRSDDKADKPEREISVSPFFIDQYEVTNQDYRRFLEATPSYPAPQQWTNRTFPAGKGMYPVTNVSFGEARAYAEWADKRLPKEEEWEYAARGGSDKRRYPWGDEFSAKYANLKGSGYQGPVAVDATPADESPFHVFGMEGNVAEWIGALYKPYPNSTAEHRPNRFIVRGGDYEYERPECEITHRRLAKLEDRAEFLGFRCAKDAPPPPQ